MPRYLKHILTLFALFVVAACSGGGCSSGCSSCAGMGPVTSDFKPEQRIENSGSVRLTQSGLQFIEDNIPALAGQFLGDSAGTNGVVTFPIPETSGTQYSIEYKACPDGVDPSVPTCTAEIDIGNADLHLASAQSHNLKITGTIPLRLKDLPLNVKALCAFGGCLINSTTHATLTGNNACPGGTQDYLHVPLDIDISITADTDPAHIRKGYSRVKFEKIEIDEDTLKGGMNFCGGGIIGSTLDIDLIKNLLFDQLMGPLTGTITEQADAALCQKADPAMTPACPAGTNDVDGTCRYGTDADSDCLATLLGTSGNLNLGGMLSSISPGARGGMDFLFAVGGEGPRGDGQGSWGDLNPVAGGATLGMYGGAKATPISQCVPLSTLAQPSGIAIPNELMMSDDDLKSAVSWPADVAGPHLGIAISERYANYALAQIYNSGALCIGISTESQAMLNSGLFSLLAPSLKDLGIQQESQQVAIVVRPNEAPTVTFGNGTSLQTDPTVRIGLKDASFDFYVWSLDRFIRFMTATYDLDIPLNLNVTPEGLTPVLNELGVTNGVVSNSSLLREDPAKLATAIQGLISSQVGQALGGGISPINLNDSLSSLGMQLIIPDSADGKGSPGLRKLSRGSDNYLGIFASLALAPAAPTPAPIVSQTTAEVTDKNVDGAGLSLPTVSETNAPTLTLQMSSDLDGPHAVEYAYRVDSGLWHSWSRDRVVTIRDEGLRLQGRHTISARSRVAGDPRTMSEPVAVEVLIDVDAPTIALSTKAAGSLTLDVQDRVSGLDQTMARFRLDDGAWSEWAAASKLTNIDAGDASVIEVQARDEEGNIAESVQPLIRGRVESAASGCGCSVPGTSGTTGKGIGLLGIALLGVFARLARRRRASERGVVVGSSSGSAPSKQARRPLSTKRARLSSQLIGWIVVFGVAGSWSGCSCGSDSETGGGKQYTCEAPDCETLKPGLIGAYTSVAVAGGDVWVAGYAEADYDEGYTWGDLAVGKWNDSAKSVDWKIVDGLSADEVLDDKVTNKDGFRGGLIEPGDDVGTWTSIAMDGTTPAVAYYDRTHGALKFARLNGSTWDVSTVEQKDKSDIGRYAKLMFLGGKPVIAYSSIEPGGKSGALLSKIRIATGNSAAPTSWAFEDAVTNDTTPCRVSFCGATSKCIASTGACTETVSGCEPACASGEACVSNAGAPTCEPTFDAKKLDAYPEAVGDYISVAPDGKGGFGIAYYDRIKGNLAIASKSAGGWTTTIVDGEANGADTGDMGIGASLFIDTTGAYHITYVDGLSESLRYVKVTAGVPGPTSIVDDGVNMNGQRQDGGQRLVGDDSHVYVTPSGEIHVTYQDATTGKLRYAKGTPGSDAIMWTIKEITHESAFSGAFSSIIEVGGAMKLVHWWRVGGEKVAGDVEILGL